MASFYRISLLACLLSLPASLFAAEITGTVTNGTTNQPASGDAVALLSLAGGMQEVAQGRTDSQGHFRLNVPDEGSQHLVRVTRQGVTYFQAAPPGTPAVNVTVYDAATQMEGVVQDALVYQIQAAGGELEVKASYSIINHSQPARTKIGNQTFAVNLPEGAELVETYTVGSSGMPVTVNTVPSGVKNRYAFDFAIRPGTSKLEVVYKIPYNGTYEFSVTPETPMSELGVLLPKSMTFTGTAGSFSQDSDEAGMAVFFTKNIATNQKISFSVSGHGQTPVPGEGDSGQAPGPANSGSPETGGNAYWYLIAVMAILIVGGGIWLWRRTAAVVPAKMPKSAAKSSPSQKQAAGAGQGNMMDVLKDELFQLETDRLNGKITDEEYEKTKAGLDTLLRRQIKKS